MSTYAFRDAAGDIVLMGPEFERPTPAHAQDAAAIREAERARRRRYGRDIVTELGNPAQERYTGPAAPAAAHKLKRLAEAHGWTVTLYELDDRCALQGTRGDLGFRAYWTRGRTVGASWHERRDRYTLVADDRPVGVDQRARVGKKGHRSPGVGTTRLGILALRTGLPCSVTELERRITL